MQRAFSTLVRTGAAMVQASARPTNNAIKTVSVRSNAVPVSITFKNMTNAFQENAIAVNNDKYELCAVPKKKISVHKRRLRKEGQWLHGAKTLYKTYRICLQCNKPMLPHTVCNTNKQCMEIPRV